MFRNFIKNKESFHSSTSGKIKRKVKLTELLVHEPFLEKRQQVKNKAQTLRMLEKLAKARAKAQIFENVKVW